MKKLSILLVALALMSFIAGAGAFAAAAPKVLTIGVDQEAVGIDPHIVTAFSSMRRIDLMYNRLVRLDDSLAVVPDLAESWDIPNNLTYVFHLRKGVKFHNGREMTADDVQYSLQRIMDPKTASPGASYISLVKSIDIVDRYTVRLNLSAPLASLLDGLTSNNCAIVAKEVVTANGNLQKVDGGTGPFMLQDWVADNSMTLVKNPDYFEKGYPVLDKVIFRVIPEQASLLAGVKSGDLDMATINDGAIIRQAASTPQVVVMGKPGLNVRTFSFNTTHKPFDDVRVRDAMALALDRSEILTLAEFGMGQPTGPIPVAATQWALPVSTLPFAPSWTSLSGASTSTSGSSGTSTPWSSSAADRGSRTASSTGCSTAPAGSTTSSSRTPTSTSFSTRAARRRGRPTARRPITSCRPSSARRRR
jgi:peptide/nickel transport system substrate-binding protein